MTDEHSSGQHAFRCRQIAQTPGRPKAADRQGSLHRRQSGGWRAMALCAALAARAREDHLDRQQGGARNARRAGGLFGADLVADDIGTLPTLLVFPRPDGSPMSVPPRRLLAHELVRFAGEAVAADVATSRTVAQSAAEAIVVEYKELPAVVDPLAALKPGAPMVWSEVPDNIVARMNYGDAAAVEAAFAKAEHVVSLEVVNQRVVPSAMEPRSTIAEVEKKTGRLILHVQSQTPGSTRDILAEAVLKRPKESIQVLVGDIGGGFGQKTSLYPEDGVVAYAAMKLNRKIRWRGERSDEFVGGTHGRDLTSTAEFALDAKGRVQAY